MQPTVKKLAPGRYVVSGRRVYGRYRTLEMAQYRAEQVAVSARPPRKPLAKAA